MCACIFVWIDGLTAPQGEIVKKEVVVPHVAIDHRTEFAVANGQSFFEKGGWFVVPEPLWQVLRKGYEERE